jgi:hypothetical protein
VLLSPWIRRGVCEHPHGAINMSERAIAFVEEFVSENVDPDGYEPDDDNSHSAALAARCIEAAKAAGIPETEMKSAFEDLTAFMAGAIHIANDDAVARLVAKKE